MNTIICYNCGEVFNTNRKEIDDEELEGHKSKYIPDCPYCCPEKYDEIEANRGDKI